MKRRMIPLLLLLLMIPVGPAEANPLRETADGYLRALCATLAEGATESDIERALSFCADDVVYEHPLLGIRIDGKAQMREGMQSHLKDYVGTPDESGLVVLSRIEGHDSVALGVRETFFVEQDGKRVRVRREKLRVLEFHDGRIKRVMDY